MQTAIKDFSSNSGLRFEPHRRSSPSPFLFNDRFIRHTTSPCIIDDQTLLEDDETEPFVKSDPTPAAPISASPAALFLSAFSSPKPAAPPPPDAEGSVVGGYTLGSIIGYGAFSTIRKGFSGSGGVVAVKIVRHSDYFKQGNASAARKRIKHEANIWSTLSHEHILPLFTAVHTRYADFFVTIFCPAGSLFDILKRDGTPALPQDDAGMMFRQVVRGLRYLHEVAMYVHRDIKLENVLVDEMGVCRIGDFGMTRKIGEIDEEEGEQAAQDQDREPFQNAHSSVHRAVSLAVPPSRNRPLVLQHSTRGASTLGRHRNSTSSAHPATQPPVFQPGSLPYAAPELLLPQGTTPLAPHPAQDIWALGVLLYALLTGRLPFMDNFEPRLQMKILNGTYEVPAGIGRGAEKVLQGCIDSDVNSRWTVARVDEQAWGVGWGDDVTPADSDEEEEYSGMHTPASASMTPRIPEDNFCPRPMDWQAEDSRSRSSVEAASRRSTSRAQRSLSRAPVLITSRSTSSARPSPALSSSHSHNNEPRKSRPHSPSGGHGHGGLVINTRVGGEHVAGGGDDTRSLSSSRTDTDSYFDPPAIISPAPSSALLERGRKLRKPQDVRSQSRSTSPSVIHTPSDVYARSPPPATAELDFGDDDKERSASRGRPKYTRFGARTDSKNRHLHLNQEEGELEVLDEHEGWEASEHSPVRPRLRPSSSSSRGIKLMSSRSRSKVSARSAPGRPELMDETWLSKKRAGSSPPVRKEYWIPSSAKGTPSFVTPASASVKPSHTLVCATPTFSLDGVARRLTRSRSLDMLKSTTA